jgi:LysM repeat protein
MFFKSSLFAVSAFALGASAHIAMVSPPPFRGKTNPNVSNPDFNMVAPLEASGSNFPCKGYHADFGTPAGKPTADFPAGSKQAVTLEGVAAAHNGGSCQMSLSFDGGKTFKVIKSYIGNCVRSQGGNVFDPNQTYEFTVPADAKSGPAILSWSWFNQSGNREMYQNCAPINISGAGASTLDALPNMFVANVGTGCGTSEGSDVEFPNPGADVERGKSVNGAGTGAPTGNCGGAPPAGAPPAAPAAPAPAAPAPVAAPIAAGGGGTHTVAAGEFCASIAQSKGVTVDQLLKLNPAVNAGCTNLQVGQVLNLRRRSRVMRF